MTLLLQSLPLVTQSLFLAFAVENAIAMARADPTILTQFAGHRARAQRQTQMALQRKT